jgi:hypothetical protein
MQNISGKSQFIGKSPTITVIFGNLWKFPAWTRSRNGNFGKFLEIPEEPEFPKRNFQTLIIMLNARLELTPQHRHHGHGIIWSWHHHGHGTCVTAPRSAAARGNVEVER